MFPQYKEKGINAIRGQLVMFTSDQVTTRFALLHLHLTFKFFFKDNIPPSINLVGWVDGCYSVRCFVFQSHYSIKSCASVCGLGTDNCVIVPSDENGKMITSELERLVIDRKNKGHIPFFVSVTSGTTVLGAFDPISEVADICDKYKLWLHVDVSN